jgi:hypothetical protein
MVGRILKHLKERRVLIEPLRSISARKRSFHRPYGARKPKGYLAQAPGDIVQVDTLDLRPFPGVVLKQLTARDMVSRWDVLELHREATAKTTVGFLGTLQARMPFEVKAILHK